MLTRITLPLAGQPHPADNGLTLDAVGNLVSITVPTEDHESPQIGRPYPDVARLLRFPAPRTHGTSISVTVARRQYNWS